MWYLVMRRAVKPRTEWTVSLDDHLVWMKKQHDAGNILFSGPTKDRQFGIYVIRADARSEAEQIAASDPYTAAGLPPSIYTNGKCIKSWAPGILPQRDYRGRGSPG